MSKFEVNRDAISTLVGAGDWIGHALPSMTPDAIQIRFSGSSADAFKADGAVTRDSDLTTLDSFTGADGENPFGSLIADASGNLFGTTTVGGSDGDGTVFEIARAEGGYAIAPETPHASPLYMPWRVMERFEASHRTILASRNETPALPQTA